MRGFSKTKEYKNWLKMLDRCRNPKARDYPSYGGRGISVCERWKNFEDFIADMGPRPSDQHSLERNDNDGDYEPSNCRWATRLEQTNNTRRNRFVIYRGSKMTLAQAVRAAGNLVSYDRAKQRLNAGWPVDAAVEASIDLQRCTQAYRESFGW